PLGRPTGTSRASREYPFGLYLMHAKAPFLCSRRPLTGKRSSKAAEDRAADGYCENCTRNELQGDGYVATRVGQNFGKYKINRLLGKGGMGEVYEAFDTSKGRTVALKILSDQYSQDERFRERFQRESRAA